MSALEDVIAAMLAAVARLEDAAAAVAEVVSEADTGLDVAVEADVPDAIEVLTELKDEGDLLSSRLADDQAMLLGYAHRIQDIIRHL
jgi:hypothetical protein